MNQETNAPRHPQTKLRVNVMELQSPGNMTLDHMTYDHIPISVLQSQG